MSRTQWLPAWLEGEQLEWALLQELRRSHRMAEEWRWIRSPCSGERLVLQEW